MPTQCYGDLELEEDLTFERRSWRFQRVGWAALGVFLMVSLAGLTGSGPLTHATARSEDGDSAVGYERFDRNQSPSTMEFEFGSERVQEGEIQLWIDGSYLRQVRLEQIIPEPDSVDIDTDRYTFTFKVSAESSPAALVFDIRLQEPGTDSSS